MFDVTDGGRHYYGKGKGYNGFVARDGTRAFVTGCYTPRGLTHDLRGLDADQIKVLRFMVYRHSFESQTLWVFLCRRLMIGWTFTARTKRTSTSGV